MMGLGMSVAIYKNASPGTGPPPPTGGGFFQQRFWGAMYWLAKFFRG